MCVGLSGGLWQPCPGPSPGPSPGSRCSQLTRGRQLSLHRSLRLSGAPHPENRPCAHCECCFSQEEGRAGSERGARRLAGG